MYYYSDAFLNINLAIPGVHIPHFEAFLAKSSGILTVYPTDTTVFVKNSNGHILGWTRSTAQYEKFAYYGTKMEKVVLSLDRKRVLHQLQYIRAELDSKKDKIRFSYDAKNEQIQFSILDESNAVTSLPITIHKVRETEGKDLTAFVNVNHMMNLFKDSVGNEIDLRILVLEANEKRSKQQCMFRTIDEFLLDHEGKVAGPGGQESAPEGTYLCKVTRYAPGKD